MGEIKDASKIDGSGDTSVKHEDGQVILLDFWATWCPPCQAPMAHNQKMLEDNKETWGDKVRLIGLSIDQSAEKVKSHVEAKGWGLVEHYHVRNGKCQADKEFGVQGVPHVALVDTKGNIVFVGHPASRKLEEDINTLLKGEKISGAGTTAAGGDDEDEELTSNVPADSSVSDMIKKFNELSEQHCQTEETKTACEGMPRAFCVLVHEQKYDCKKGELINNLKNYQVLVGSQEKIDGVKKILEPFNEYDKKGWELIPREQVI